MTPNKLLDVEVRCICGRLLCKCNGMDSNIEIRCPKCKQNITIENAKIKFIGSKKEDNVRI
jgi:phage FluMu protein Com